MVKVHGQIASVTRGIHGDSILYLPVGKKYDPISIGVPTVPVEWQAGDNVTITIEKE